MPHLLSRRPRPLVWQDRLVRIGRKPALRAKLRQHNSRQLSRVYPKGTRFSSNNMSASDYCDALAMGCHMVALNFQTWDGAMQLNDALFSRNARRGYVLKPPPVGPDAERHGAAAPLLAERSSGERLGEQSSPGSQDDAADADDAAARDTPSPPAVHRAQSSPARAGSRTPQAESGRLSERSPLARQPARRRSVVDERRPSLTSTSPEGLALHVTVHSAQHLPKRDGERLVPDPWDDGSHGGPWVGGTVAGSKC